MIYLSLSHSDTAEDGGLQTRLSGPKRRQEGSWFVTGVTSWEHEIKRCTMQQMVADYCVIFFASNAVKAIQGSMVFLGVISRDDGFQNKV